MPVTRGLVPPALITSTIVLVLCSLAWGALGMVSLVDPTDLPDSAQSYLRIMLATLTICSLMVNLIARSLRSILAAIAAHDDGYAAGYADGLDARPGVPVSPGVSRLMPTRH